MFPDFVDLVIAPSDVTGSIMCETFHHGHYDLTVIVLVQVSLN